MNPIEADDWTAQIHLFASLSRPELEHLVVMMQTNLVETLAGVFLEISQFSAN